MSSLILCHKKKARNAYEIARIHRRIYTMEEEHFSETTFTAKGHVMRLSNGLMITKKH